MGANPYEEAEKKEARSTVLKTKQGEFDSDGYLINNVNWNISFNYSLRYGYGEFNKERMEYSGKLTHNFGMSGSLQPTKKLELHFQYRLQFRP